MYFFDFADYCYSRAVGTNSLNLFTSPDALYTWEDVGSTARATRDALNTGVGRWYNLSNPEVSQYVYNSTTNLSWPASPAGYTLYNGGFTNFDDGHTTVPIVLPRSFKVNGVESTNLYVSTNGFFTLNSGSGTRFTSPTVGPPATMCANPGDNWLEPGLYMPVDGTTQNLYYKTGYDGLETFYVKLLVYGGQYGSPTTPTSWIANFYRDSRYQWLETRAKSNLIGNAGPYDVVGVAQPSSTTSKVWRGDLNGQNWTYLGTGTVATSEELVRLCPDCHTYYTQFTAATTTSFTNFWVDANYPSRFSNTTQSDFTAYIQNIYHAECLLRQLLKCVDGDTFPTFDI
jgi:hypothetical protein